MNCAIEQNVQFSKASTVVGKNAIGESDFVLVDHPIAQGGIVFRQKNDLKIDFVPLRECVEDGNTIWGDDLGDDEKAGNHAENSIAERAGRTHAEGFANPRFRHARAATKERWSIVRVREKS